MKTYQLKKSKFDMSQFEEFDSKLNFIFSIIINQLKLASEIIDSAGILNQTDDKNMMRTKALQSNITSLSNFDLDSSEYLEFTDVFEYDTVQLNIAEKQVIIEYIKNIDPENMNEIIDTVIEDSTIAEHEFEMGIEDTSNPFRKNFGNDIILKLKENDSDDLLSLNVYEKRFISIAIESLDSVDLKNTILEKLQNNIV